MVISGVSLFNVIAVTLPRTGQTPQQQLLKVEVHKDSQELKVAGEGNKKHACIASVGYCDICQY